ncbi:MFS transporter [Actinomadura barringtoniae]|uniref:MFS transporter n=1 Tax=Actinomadura barringtoniae TaxID=1427535 RepID=A0A939T465_9ACTN|nr:oligopeptide:H+ symporter [Actinomadura barringtoniae]MBO2447774.1 MFS transporter [Actinomadura barringtoniae]
MIQIVPRRVLPATGPARPSWFVCLFLTDVWERFSFYGMQAILVLYAAAPESDGGLGLPKATAAALFGVYMATVFMLALPGGWLGDRVLGERRAVLYGAVTVAAGHYCMALPPHAFTFAGLVLIAVGTGLLKPNMSGLLTRFYAPGQEIRREAASAVFYIAVQVSALLAPLVTGLLSDGIGWHAGFAAAGVGMTFGVIQFAIGGRSFGDVGAAPARPAPRTELRRALRRAIIALAVAGTLVGLDAAAGTLTIKHILVGLGLVAFVVPPLGYLTLRRHPALTPSDRTRLGSYLWLLVAAALFWMVVGQAGSLLNLFAKHSTNRDVAGFTIPAAWFQSTTPLFILITAPLFAAVSLRLGARAGVRVKVTLGLVLAGCGFLVMSLATLSARDGALVSPAWLVGVYLLHACGEITLGPSGLAAMADAAPASFRGRVMGLWWLFCALGMAVGSRVVLLSDVLPAPLYFLIFGLLPVLAAFALVSHGRRRATAPEPAADPEPMPTA